MPRSKGPKVPTSDSAFLAAGNPPGPGWPLSFSTDRLPPVLVVGDLIHDRMVWGDVERVSPEAPVQVLKWEREADAAGGAANVAMNLASLGCRVRLVGAVGQDFAGERLIETLERKSVDVSGVITVPARPTSQKMRIVARGQHILRIDREEAVPFRPGDERRLAGCVKRHARGASGIICSDYGKGVCFGPVLAAVAELSKRHRSRKGAGNRPYVLVDPKEQDFSRYQKVDVLTPNAKEVVEATREMKNVSPGEAGMDSRARHLIKRTGVQALLVTKGADGMDLYETEKGAVRKTPIPVLQTHEVYDVTGAGDTVTGIMGMAAFGGVPLAKAAVLANAAAGIVVGMVGTAVIEPEALLRATDGGFSLSGLKILSRSTLKARVEEARARREKVVFTNGCFDLLHMGHLHLLQRARAFGDLLVVGINDDASVRKLKGQGRPLIGQDQRAELLASLRFVDYVTTFPEPTPLRLLRAVRPDVLVKGGDYSLDQVVGRDWVESYGGRVERVPLLPGFSTSSLVGAIHERGR